MNCRKCGAKKVTRRRAGTFFCQRCGMQPGVDGFDRFGNPAPRSPTAEPGGPAYEIGALGRNLVPAVAREVAA